MTFSRLYATWHDWPTATTIVNSAWLTSVDDALAGPGGDAQSVYNATSGQLISPNIGTSTTPDTSLNPGLKVARLIQQTAGALGGDGFEQMASILGVSVGTSTNVGQTVGIGGAAKNSSTSVAQSGAGDACGVYGVGRITGSGVGTGLNFLSGRRDTSTGRANALELSCQNYTASAGTYNSTGFSDTTGLWVEATGSSDSAVGISFGNPFGFQYDVGIAFTGQATSAKTGAVISQSIRDDGASATSIQINGTHAIAALSVAAGAGQVLLGGTSSVSGVTNNILEVQGSNNNVDGLVVIGSVANTKDYTIRVRNAVGQSRFGIVGGAGDLLTGTAAGDAVLGTTTTGKALHIGGTISTIKVGTDNTLGFFNHTTASQQTVTGSKGANAALTSLLTALAAYGIVVDSTT